MESLIKKDVSVQQFMDITREIGEWVFACNNLFYLNVDFKLSKCLGKEEKVCDISVEVTFFFLDPAAEDGRHNTYISMYDFDSEQRLNKKKELIRQALLAQSVEDLRDFVRQAKEYPE